MPIKIYSLFRTFAVAVAVALSPAALPGANDGVVDNPPQGARPYIFLTPARLAEIRAKRNASNTLWTRFAGALESYSYTSPYSWTIPEYMAANALAWRVTGEQVYLDRTRNLFAQWQPQDCYANGDGLCFQWTGRYIYWSYDWAYDGLTAEERASWRAHMKAAAMLWYGRAELDVNGHMGYNTGVTIRDSDHAAWISENLLYAGLALYGDDNDGAETLLEAHDRVNNYAVVERYLGDYFRGGFDPLGPMYGAPNISHFCRPLLVDQEARGIAMPAGAIDNFARFYIHTTFPAFKGVLQLGDVHITNQQPDSWTQEWTTCQDQVGFMSMAAGTATDPVIRQQAAYWMTRQEQVWSTGPYPFYIAQLWNKEPSYLESVLFMPIVETPVSPAEANFPTTHFFEGGMASMRSSWEDNAICLWLENTDWNVDHTHQDALHYTILRNNMPVNSELAGYWGAEYPSCYHAGAHNTLMIENTAGNNFSFAGRVGGNQYMAAPFPGGRMQSGETTINAVHGDDHFGFVEAEAAHTYNYVGWNGQNSNGEFNCDNALRKVLWIKPDVFLVYDYVKVPDAAGSRWRRQINHFHGHPELASGVYRAASDGNAYFFAPLLQPAGTEITIHDDNALFPATSGSDFLKDQKHWTMILDTGSIAGANEFLSVQYVAADTVAAMPQYRLLQTVGGTMAGAFVLRDQTGHVALMKKGPGTVSSGSYAVTQPGVATVEHVLANLPPNQAVNVVSVANKALGDFSVSFSTGALPGSVTLTTSAEGTLDFTTINGALQVPTTQQDAWIIF